MGAQTFGSDVSGPATAADPLHRLDEGDALLQQAAREDLENLLRDFGALGLAPPRLVEADVGDETSRIRRSR